MYCAHFWHCFSLVYLYSCFYVDRTTIHFVNEEGCRAVLVRHNFVLFVFPVVRWSWLVN